VSNDSCGAPAGGVTITKDKSGKEAIVEGHVLNGGSPVSTGYARLLGTGDEFVAEVPLGEDGGFGSSPRQVTGRCACSPGRRSPRAVGLGGHRPHHQGGVRGLAGDDSGGGYRRLTAGTRRCHFLVPCWSSCPQ